MPELGHDPETVRDWYRRAIESTTNIVNAVRDSLWGNSTPCDEWDVKDVVNHVVNENLWMVELFNGKTIAEVGSALDGDLVGDDPRGVWNRSAASVLAILDEDDAMSRTCQISSGPVSGAEYASQLFLDTLVHGWDISVGAEAPAVLDTELVEACIPMAKIAVKYAAGSGLYADSIDVGDDADAQKLLLAILGRES